MTNLLHISSLYTESWVAWVMFVLLVVALLNPLPQTVGVTLHGIFSHSERAYVVRSRNWASEVALRIFRLGIMTMAAMLLVCLPTAFTLLVFAKVLGLFALVSILQTLLLYGVGAVFISGKRMDAAIEQHNNIRTMICVSLYPILLLLTNVSSPILPWVLCGIVAVLYIAILIGKSCQLFYTHPLSILYILLYILFLEILPWAVGIFVVQYII